MKFALIGHQISYSLSPIIHELISNEPIEYDIVDIAPESLEKGLPEELLALDGFNITIPHKQSIMSFCKELDPMAKRIGAVNTVDINNGVLRGYNTDYLGFMSSLKENITNYFDYFPVLVGYGGVARAVIIALEKMGFKIIAVVGGISDKERGKFIAEMASVCRIKILEQIPDCPCMWINGTPVGGAKIPEVPEDYLPLQYKDILYDLNYAPFPTHLERYAQAKGLKTVNGLNMLVSQAVEAQRIWFKDKAGNVDVKSVIRSLASLNTVS